MSRFSMILMLRWGASVMLTFVLASLFSESAAATVRQLSRGSATVEASTDYAQVKQPKGGTILPKGTTPSRPKGTVAPPPKGTTPSRPKGTVAPPPKGTTPSRPKGTVAPPPKGTTPSRPKGTVAPPPKGTTPSRPKGIVPRPPKGTTSPRAF